MSERPTFAVVIPTYNRARRLLGTLETVFAQEEPATQIIVVDDCSTDETPEAVAALLPDHPELVYIRHPVNRERAAARNTGMEAATTDYVTFLDSDDIMYPSCLRDAADFAARTGAKWFHNLYHSVDSEGRHLRDQPAPPVADYRRHLALGNFPSCIGVFVHREIYERYHFDPEPVLTTSEDYELWLRVAADYPIERIERVNSAFVEHEGRSVVNQETDAAERRMEYILDGVRSDEHLRTAWNEHLGRLEAGRMLILASIANGNGEGRRAFGYLRRALTAHPAMAFNRRFLRLVQLSLGNVLRASRPSPS